MPEVPMAERLTVYQAADGTIFDSESEAVRHDARKSILSKAQVYLDQHTGYRTISRNKALNIMVDFAVDLIFDPDKLEKMELDNESE